MAGDEGRPFGEYGAEGRPIDEYGAEGRERLWEQAKRAMRADDTQGDR